MQGSVSGHRKTPLLSFGSLVISSPRARGSNDNDTLPHPPASRKIKIDPWASTLVMSEEVL